MGVGRLVSWLFCFWKEVLVISRDAVGQKSEDRPSQQGEPTFWPGVGSIPGQRLAQAQEKATAWPYLARQALGCLLNIGYHHSALDVPEPAWFKARKTRRGKAPRAWLVSGGGCGHKVGVGSGRRLTIRSRRLAPAAIHNHSLLAQLMYNEVSLAHSQAP